MLLRSEVLRVVWLTLLQSVNMTGKNQQQIMQAIVQKIKTHHKLLSTFATSGKLELALLVVVQASGARGGRRGGRGARGGI